MTVEQCAAIERRLARFVDTYRDRDGALPPMHQLKWRHTAAVVANAQQIMAAEAWSAAREALGWAAALLHDVGRFQQFRDYGTFRDHASVDHALLGCRIIVEHKLLDGVAPDEAGLVIAAVRLHNVKELPPLGDRPLAPLATLVRDADKLDIFRVFEEAMEQRHLAANPEIVWNVSMEGRVSEGVLAALEAGRPVDHKDIATFYDFVMSQVSWLDGQLHYGEARRLARVRGVLDYRERLVLDHCADQRLAAIFRRVREICA